MREQIAKAFFLQELELAVLFVMKGQNELFGLRLNQIEKINEQMLYQTIFRLVKHGMLEKEDDGFKIREDINALLEDMILAKHFMVLAFQKENSPENYFYIGKRVVCIQSAGQQGEMFRIEAVPVDNMTEYVMNHGFCVEGIRKTEDISKQEKIEEIPDFPFSLQEYWQEEKDVILQNEHISSIMILYDVASREKQNQYCILSHQLDDYFIWCDESKEEIYPYSNQTIEAILKGVFV